MNHATRAAAVGQTTRWRLTGTTMALAILAVSLAQAVTPLARTVDYTFPALTILGTLYFLRRRRLDLAVELDLWMWVVAPGLRRVVDWSSGSFNASSPILATAAIAALVISVVALQPRRRWPVGFGFGFFVYFMAGAFAGVIGTANNGFVAATVSGLLWFAPLGLGLTLLAASRDRAVLVPAVLRFTRWALLGLSGYAVLQWALAPAWDVFWLAGVSPYAEWLGSPFGTPEPLGLRPSSTSNSPFVFAHTLVWLLVSQIGQVRHQRLSQVGIVLGCIALGLTGIRSAWLTGVLVVLVLRLSGRIRLAPLAVLGGVAAYLIFSLAPSVGQLVGQRLGTLQAGAADTSVIARSRIYADALPTFLRDGVGAGLGATGAGLRAGEENNPTFAVLDSSYLEILRTSGAVLGGLAVVAVVALSIAAFARSRGLPDPYPAWGALALVVPVDMLLGGVTSGPTAVVTWFVLGACAAAQPPTNLSGEDGVREVLCNPESPERRTLDPSEQKGTRSHVRRRSP